MKKNMFIMMCAVVVLAGCASTQRQPITVTYLPKMKKKIIALEERIEEKDKQISELQYQIDDLNAQLESLEPAQKIFPVEPVAMESRETNKPSSASAERNRSDQRIIRVDIDTKMIQTALKQAGYYQGAVDGKIGPQSKKAIKEFQADHSLKVDGIIGKNTWAELKLYLE